MDKTELIHEIETLLSDIDWLTTAAIYGLIVRLGNMAHER